MSCSLTTLKASIYIVWTQICWFLMCTYWRECKAMKAGAEAILLYLTTGNACHWSWHIMTAIIVLLFLFCCLTPLHLIHSHFWATATCCQLLLLLFFALSADAVLCFYTAFVISSDLPDTNIFINTCVPTWEIYRYYMESE